MAVKASGRFVPPSAFAAGTGKAFTGAYAWNAPREAVGRERPLTRDEMRQVQGVLSTINRLPYFLRSLFTSRYDYIRRNKSPVSDSRLLPTGSSPLEVAAAKACAEIEKTPVRIRELWNPDTCPANLLPWLAWAFSVDRWDEKWPEATKRAVIRDAYFIHCHKGTIGAIRRVVEPLGYLINVTEWWENSDPPGTFRLDIGVLESGITEAMYQEMERLIADAKPASRHLIGLNITRDIPGYLFAGGVAYDGDVITVYPG